jgi:hypothetical protein
VGRMEKHHVKAKNKMMKINIKYNAIPLFGLIVLLAAPCACDDGELNTLLPKQNLSVYMEDNADLMLYFNSLDNYRESIYLCFYDADTHTRYNTEPIGKYQSEGGIPYGEATAVKLPPIVEKTVVAAMYLTDGNKDCLNSDLDYSEPEGWSGETGAIPIERLRIRSKWLHGVLGYIAPREGFGEDWDGCGEEGEWSCSLELPFSVDVSAKAPLAGKTSIKFHRELSSVFASRDQTICWDPDNNGSESSILLAALITDDRDPATCSVSKNNLTPMTTGTIHLHLGRVNCADAAIADAAATLPLPADATFGPAGSKIVFDADESATLLVTGSILDGIPQEGGLRMTPIPNWFEHSREGLAGGQTQ